MRETRIYTEAALSVNAQVTLEEGPSRHLLSVLRLKAGAALRVFNGDGNDYLATLEPSGKRAIALITEAQDNPSESPLKLTLAQCISKGERMDYTLQKSTELGVGEIYPLYSQRTEVKLKGDRAEKKLRHWRGIVQSACEQSGRSTVPIVHPPQTLNEYLKSAFEHDVGLVFAPEAGVGMHALPEVLRHISLLIGPEGGLEPAEIALAQQSGFALTRLGPRILRTETAPLCAMSILQARYGDLG